jgi:hypothetical protein
MGSFADRIRVPDEFVVAIENALGHHLQLVLTEQPGVGAKDSPTSPRARPAVPAAAFHRTHRRQAIGLCGRDVARATAA